MELHTGRKSMLSLLKILHKFDFWYPLRQKLEAIEIKDINTAHLICKLIPAQCPFAREIKFLGRTILRIPPMCKLNPLYNQIMELRFKSLCYLADVCNENIMAYL